MPGYVCCLWEKPKKKKKALRKIAIFQKLYELGTGRAEEVKQKRPRHVVLCRIKKRWGEATGWRFDWKGATLGWVFSRKRSPLGASPRRK